MLNVVHMTFKFRVANFERQKFAKVLFVVVDVHSAALEKEPKLSSPLVFQVVVFLQLSVEMKHAGREIFFADGINVFKIQLEFTVKFGLIDGRSGDTVDGLVHERFELIFDIIFKDFLSLDSDFHQFFFQEIEVQVFDNVDRSLNVGVNKALVDVAFSPSEASLTKLERYFHESMLIDYIAFGPVIPVSDSDFVLTVLLSADGKRLN